MSQVMTQQSTPIESVPELEPGIVEKLVAAGITTVEQVADMTPEQLEEIPGVGPKTIEKISIAVNNYFASLDSAAVAEVPIEGEEAAVDEALEEGPVAEESSLSEEAAEAIADGDSEVPSEIVGSGDLSELSGEPEASSESVQELVDEGQYFEAEVVDGVENAPDADVAEVTTHERPVVEGENIPDEELPGEQR